MTQDPNGGSPPLPDDAHVHQLMVAASAGGWRANLYVTFLLWRQLRKAPGPRKQARERLVVHNHSHGSAPSPVGSDSRARDLAQRVPDGPWDDAQRPNRRLRSCLIMAGLLVLAWLTADLAAAALADLDFGRLFAFRG